MRYCLRTAFFAFISLAALNASSQGRMHVTSLSVDSFFEPNETGDEIIQKAEELDSIRAVEALAS